jgi:hypothetical protein
MIEGRLGIALAPTLACLWLGGAARAAFHVYFDVPPLNEGKFPKGRERGDANGSLSFFRLPVAEGGLAPRERAIAVRLESRRFTSLTS